MNARAPRVSVLMTIYNAQPFLRESIDSLVSQSFDDWELVALENGSTDGSSSVLAEYSDARVRALPFARNIGRTAALRHAFAQARGEYIAVLDADDVALPERLKLQTAFLDEHPQTAIVGSWVRYIDRQSRAFAEFRPPTGPEELRECLGWTNPIVHSSAMFRKQSAVAAGGYPADLVYAQDFGLTIALARRSGIAMIPEFLAHQRVSTSSMTASGAYRTNVASEELSIYQRAASQLALSAHARRLNRRAQAVAEIKLGVATMRANAIFQGLRHVARGLAKDPSALWANGPMQRMFRADAAYLTRLPSAPSNAPAA